MPQPPARHAAAVRTDGAEARTRLLHTALRLFSEKGFTRTSTREIAQAADANVAAIRYYFGDKAGLYAATFTEPLGTGPRDVAQLYDRAGLTLRESLAIFYAGMAGPLKQGALIRQCLRLHIREMLEPTALWAEEMEKDCRQPHEAMVRLLCRHLGLPRADDDVHRLAFAVNGMAVQVFVGLDAIDAIRPSLLATPEAIDAWAVRMVDDALALVTVERGRRRKHPVPVPAPAPAAARKTKPKTRTIAA